MKRPANKNPPGNWFSSNFNDNGWQGPTGPSNAHWGNHHKMNGGVWVNRCKYTFYRIRAKEAVVGSPALGG